MKCNIFLRTILVTLVILLMTGMKAQRFNQPTSSEIYQKIQKLGVLGNVLYLAAHPDDENTRFIAYSANHKLFNTAYLSLTRGDGGQNLIGPELREELGIIRTQELLAARRTDGGEQYFTRANDFGYSKTADETLEIWDKDKILSDVVWVIRQFRPDVIVCRFPINGGGGHGHHTASALLGLEAFEISGNPGIYSEQLDYVEPWQPLRIVVNTGRWWNDSISANDPNVVAHDIGTYDALQGISHTELASQSRTMHKSQGFGSTGTRGERVEFFEHLGGTMAENDLFEGYEKDWSRVRGGQRCVSITDELQRDFDLVHPEKSITKLLELRRAVEALNDEYWKSKKLAEIDDLIKDCAGLYIEARSEDQWASPGDSVLVEVEAVSRSYDGAVLKSISAKEINVDDNLEVEMGVNEVIEHSVSAMIPSASKSSQPYWLTRKGTLGTYDVEERKLIGTPENAPSINFIASIDFKGTLIDYEMPLYKKWNDPVLGEQGRPYAITPPVLMNIEGSNFIFPDTESQEIDVKVKAIRDGLKGQLLLEAPHGWTISPALHSMTFVEKGEEQTLRVEVTPSVVAESGAFKTVFRTSEKELYSKALRDIIYDHFPAQVYMPEAEAKLVYFDLKKKGERIGYIEGAGDVTAEALRSVGYSVDELSESDIQAENLAKYDAIITGIRLMNVDERIDFYMPELLKYTENGGTLVIQYNTRHRMKTKNFAPYPITLSRDRVTEEDAEVTFLAPKHPVLNSPNVITEEDFDGWVQERGLYFPSEWANEYEPILSWHDTGEEEKKGSLLVADYGEGKYIYTGISFFRELPAGVPGAYRLLVNLLSQGND